MNATLVLLGKLTGTAALATGALVTGIHADHPGSSEPRCRASLAHASSELRADLQAARAKPAGQERREALRSIRKDARQGHYGDAAQVAALRHENARLRWRAQAPGALKAALKDARQQPAGDQRRAARAKVLRDAASGAYGARVQKIAKKRAQRQTCATQRRERRSSSPSTSGDSAS